VALTLVTWVLHDVTRPIKGSEQLLTASTNTARRSRHRSI